MLEEGEDAQNAAGNQPDVSQTIQDEFLRSLDVTAAEVRYLATRNLRDIDLIRLSKAQSH